MVDVFILEGPDMFAEFRRVPMFSVSESCCVLSVPCLKLVFCKPNVCFCNVVVLACDGCLVDDGSL